MSSTKAGRGRTVATGDTSLSPGQHDSSGGYAVDGPSSVQSSQPSQPLRAASVVDPVDFGGNISRSPSSVSVQGSSLSKGKRPGTIKKTKNPATRAVSKKNKAGKGNPVPGSSTPAAKPPTGLLRTEGVPPPRVSVRHSPSSPTESPSVAVVGDGVGFADRNPAAHSIGLGALAVGRQIAHAEPANWGSPGIPRSVGPSSSSGFTRCSGVPVTQPLSEGTSEVTPSLSSRRGKKAKKGNRSQRFSSSSDSSRESHGENVTAVTRFHGPTSWRPFRR
ncbi:uncharacterized protein LOC117294751 [Asterias rubens]|uniref:uncharacterized protein LOC117294751 n=1 Tax=Asterias rubens TaxID=7604 RepID=UPI001455D392|nr:uncharacterized protein LOC117294751 [Asterias rubens]